MACLVHIMHIFQFLLWLPYFLSNTKYFISLLVYLQIESRNNKLEMQSTNDKGLIEELGKLLDRLRIPSEVRPILNDVYNSIN